MNINRIKITLVTAISASLLLAGCATGGTHADPKVTPVTGSSTESKQTSTNDLQKAFGEVITYKTGVSVSVSQPAPYTLSESATYSADVPDGWQELLFNIQITNNSKKNVDIMALPSLNSGGVAANSTADVANGVEGITNTTLLPGQSIQAKDAYAVKDPSDLTYLITPVIGYQQAIFTTKK